MTPQSINYFNALEIKRHNQVMEALTGQGQDIQAANLWELGRHNRETEGSTWFAVRSQDATNRMNADTNARSVTIAGFNAETQRLNANTQMGQLAVSQYDADTRRFQSSLQQGELDVHKQQVAVQQANVEIAKLDAATRRLGQEEVVRNNKVVNAQGWVSTATSGARDLTGSVENITDSFEGFVRGLTGLKDFIH